jgi:signal transduction histidine kinase
MNRLWVRISLSIALVVVIVSLLPIIARQVEFGGDTRPRPTFEGLSQAQIDHIRQDALDREYRIWFSVSRSLLVGMLIGLGIGVLLSRWLAAPLHQLEQGAEALSEGRLDTRVPVQGGQEVRSLARAFNRMAEKLESTETARRNMLADVTHELRHPIHILQGNLQAVLDGIYPLEMGEIAGLLDQTQHLTILVNDLHELAQAEAHQLILHKQETDMTALVANMIEVFQPLAAAEEIRMEAHLPGQPLLRSIDAERMRQVLQNLLHNALQHTAPGGEIAIDMHEKDERVEIQIRDSGAGIAADQLAHIFDRFYNSDPSRDRQNGSTGLGLAITQAIIQAHGGEIEAFSAGKGQGSTFTIRL